MEVPVFIRGWTPSYEASERIVINKEVSLLKVQHSILILIPNNNTFSSMASVLLYFSTLFKEFMA